MKRLLLSSAVLFTILFSLACFAQRLPELARPTNYKLTFAPDFDHDNFAGQETIAIEVLKPTSEIVLNAVDIQFQSASISAAGATQQARVSLDNKKQQATLAVDKALQPGPATIQIHYTGILNNELRGFYLGKDEQGRRYAVTQFEATDARRAFPSFDEPAYKATFDITVIADKKHTAISNGRVLSDSPGPAEGKHTIKFSTTPKMSSYLVAVAVGEFESVEGEVDGIPIRVWGTPGKKEMGRFALESAKFTMHYYNQYFGIKYPFQKLDLIGLPDFAAGAMENTGCITFREAILLIDDQHASVGLKQTVADVIAHEMAHQWFGDLVTMQWWDDIWLNEGFATWMSSKPVAAWKPEWHVELDDVRATLGSLNVDSLRNTRPIHQEAETPAQIQELFDGIAYGKTAAVLRMLEAYLGPQQFRSGVNAYLKQHAYANATASDFWSALAKASGKPVDRVMPTFVQQPGVPFVDVRAHCAGKNTEVALQQQRYYYDRELFNSDKSGELWQIPVCLKEGKSGPQGKEAQECRLITEKQASFDLPGCGPWTLSNAGAHGFYLSGYDPENLRAISRDLETQLTPAERIMLLGDAWAAVRVGKVPISEYMGLSQGLQNDPTRAVIGQVVDQVEYIGEYLTSEADKPQYQAWVRQLLAPTIHRLGFEPKAGESDDDKQLRPHVLQVDGYIGHDPEVLAWARKWTDQALQSDRPLDFNVANAAFTLAALEGDSALYDRFTQKLKQAKTSEEYYAYLAALEWFQKPKLIERTLQFAISPEVRSQDAIGMISRIMEHPAGREAAWNFVKSHWSEIQKIGGGFSSSAYLVGATSSFCSGALREQTQQFFAEHKVPAAQRRLAQSLERIGYCADLQSLQGPRLAEWLSTRETRAGQ